jgi:hypothetical protein
LWWRFGAGRLLRLSPAFRPDLVVVNNYRGGGGSLRFEWFWCAQFPTSVLFRLLCFCGCPAAVSLLFVVVVVWYSAPFLVFPRFRCWWPAAQDDCGGDFCGLRVVILGLASFSVCWCLAF